MKRVLIISYYWPPSGGSGVQRWVKFSKYLPSEGWQPVVYTPLNPDVSSTDETLLKDIPAEAEIIKTHITEPYSLYRKLLGAKDMKLNGGKISPISGEKKSFKQSLSLWIRGNMFIPDPRVWWVRPSVRFLKKYLKEHPVDMIVTTGPPQSMHLIGLQLHRATGIPWLADFRDPWTKMYFYKHLHLSAAGDARHHRLEKSVLDECSTVIAVTPKVQEEFQSMTDNRVVTITNGFDEDDYPVLEGPLGVKGEFRITHTGLFAAEGNPTTLWDILAQKCAQDPTFKSALRIRLAGTVDADIYAALEARGLGANTVPLGYLSHDDVVLEQRSADILLLPLRQEPEYKAVYPGKIFEYLAAQRPILGIGEEDSASAKVISDTRTGDMFGWDNADGTRAFLETAWSRYQTGASDENGCDISRYSRRSLTRQLVQLMDSLVR